MSNPKINKLYKLFGGDCIISLRQKTDLLLQRLKS